MIRAITLSILFAVPVFAVDVREHGAIPGDGKDDAPAFQAAVDAAIGPNGDNIVEVPAGRWDLMSPVLVMRTNDAGQALMTTISIRGPEVFPYSTITGNIAHITIHHKGAFGIGLQLVKGARVENLFLQGANRISFRSPAEMVKADEKSAFTLPGVRDNQHSPYAGIVVDPFGTSGIARKDRYPGFEDRYVQGRGGSGTIEFNRCRIEGFVCGVMVSPADTANAEQILSHNCRLGQCKVGFALGQTQSRSVNLYDMVSWGPMLYLTNGSHYGAGSGPTPNMIGGQVAGAVKYLMRSTGTTTATSHWTGFFAESFYAIGATANVMSFSGCQFKLNWDIPSAATHYQNLHAHTTFLGCNIWVSTNPPNTRGLQTSGRGCDYHSCVFEVAPFARGANGAYRFESRFFGCFERHLGKSIDTMSGSVRDAKPIELAVVKVDGESFTITSKDASKWKVGDQVFTWQRPFFTDEYGESSQQYLGFVSKIAKDQVTVSKVPFNVTNGAHWLSKFEITERN